MTVFNPFRISSGTLQIFLCGLLFTTQIASGASLTRIPFAESLDDDYSLDSQAFPRIEAAVDVLSISYHQRSIREDREYMAAILEENGVYRVMVQAGPPGKHKVRMKIRRKKSQALVAVWHTHGVPAPRRELYSPTDSRMVRTTGLPLYLTTPRGKIKVLGQPENGCVGSRVTSGWNRGTIIGSI